MYVPSGLAIPALSLVLIVCSAGGILLETAWRNNPTIEAALCRFHVCASGQLIDRARSRRLDVRKEAAELGWRESLQALRRDPSSADRWCDAGESLLIVGDIERALRAFQRAMELAPNSPPILLQAANFYWRTGRPRGALRPSARILELIREYDGVIFHSYFASGLPIEDLLREGIPQDSAARRSFFEYVLSQSDLPTTRTVWAFLAAAGHQDQRLVSKYVDFLLQKGEPTEAAAVWTAHTAHKGPNILFNGGFENDFSGASLDWKLSATEHVIEERDTGSAHSGNWALKISFDGALNLQYGGPSQMAVAAPGNYRLSAWTKAAALTTDRGVALRVFDPESPSRLDIRTRELTGTTDWILLESPLTVTPATTLVQVQLIRQISTKFDSKIAGTVWIDDVQLVREP